jgi:LPS sulfotransferase NodH
MYDLATEAADYSPWASEIPDRSFVVCTSVRSGSTLLGEAMYTVGGMGCPLEYFHIGFQPKFEERWQTSDPDEYRRRLFRHRTDPTGSFGLKIFWRDVIVLCEQRYPGTTDGRDILMPESVAPQGGYAMVWRVLQELVPRARYILLARHDKARQAISAFTASRTGRWRDMTGTSADSPSPEYDYDTILRTYQHGLHTHRSWRALFAHAGITPVEIFYEDLARDLPGAVGRMLDALPHAVPHRERLTQPMRLRRQAGASSERLLMRFLRENAARRSDHAAQTRSPSAE